MVARRLYIAEPPFETCRPVDFLVTRAKSNFDARRLYSAQNDRTTGVCDQTVMLAGFYASKGYAEHLRRIRFKAPDTDKTLVFLTNNTPLPALTICALYKNHWHVELFFDVLPWGAPSYVIEKTRPVDLNHPFADLILATKRQENCQRRFCV